VSLPKWAAPFLVPEKWFLGAFIGAIVAVNGFGAMCNGAYFRQEWVRALGEIVMVNGLVGFVTGWVIGTLIKKWRD